MLGERDTPAIFEATGEDPMGCTPTARKLANTIVDGDAYTNIYTDGGVQGGGRAGAYEWVVLEHGARINGRPDVLWMAEGGRRLLAGDEWLASARAETAALAAVLLVLEPSLAKGGRITVHVDNAWVGDEHAR